MNSYDQLLERWPRKAERPFHYSDLLLYPICDDPTGDAAACYPGWEMHHVPKQRFYLGGLRWFKNNVGLSTNGLAEYRKKGKKRLDELFKSGKINWKSIPGCQENVGVYWGDIAKTQFDRAAGRERLFITKAMIMLTTCEVAVEELLAEKKKLPNVNPYPIKSPLDIYERMTIIPAGWRINNFNEGMLKSQEEEHPDLLVELARKCGYADNDTAFLEELATGSTAHFDTATLIHKHCEEVGIDLGDKPVRATPGSYGGRGDAAQNARVDCG